jgi:hypothetical protein
LYESKKFVQHNFAKSFAIARDESRAIRLAARAMREHMTRLVTPFVIVTRRRAKRAIDNAMIQLSAAHRSKTVVDVACRLKSKHRLRA